MRLKALIKEKHEYGKAIIYQDINNEVLLFLYNNAEDINCATDGGYFTSIEQAKIAAFNDFGIDSAEQKVLSDSPYLEWGGDWDTSEIKDMDQFFTVSLNQAREEDVQEVNENLSKGDVITAIKIYRFKVGVTLDEAKRAVDYLRIKMYR